MRKMMKDRYFLFCLAVGFIISISAFLMEDESSSLQIGSVSSLYESSNGFVFIFDSSEGETFKCFSKQKPDMGTVIGIDGDFSDDGGIFYVSCMISIMEKNRDVRCR